MRPSPRWVLYGAIAFLGISGGAWLGRLFAPTPRPEVIVDTAEAAAWRAREAELAKRVDEATRDRAGALGTIDQLRRRIAGLEARPPARITVYDTVIQIEQVPVVLGVEAGTTLRIDVANPVAGGHQPSSLQGIAWQDCDRGFLITPAGFICRKAPLGHLTLYAAVWSADPFAEVGLGWQPSYRSNLQVSAAFTAARRLEFKLQKGVTVF